MIVRSMVVRSMVVAIVLLTRPALAQVLVEKPDQVADVDILDKRGETLPLELSFRDSSGQAVLLRDYFDGQRPVLLSFNYASCPMLCKLQLSGLVDGLRELDWTAGEQFRVVSVSIDPAESTHQAAASKQKHVTAYGRPESKSGWTFLTGEEKNIRAAADAAGFKYRFLPKTGEYSHAAGIMVCTPKGRLSQYLYGVKYDSNTLRLSLTEASQGQMGSALDQLLLFCFRYDSTTGKYTPVAKNLMRVGALATMFGLAVFVCPFWIRSRRRKPDAETSLEAK